MTKQKSSSEPLTIKHEHVCNKDIEIALIQQLQTHQSVKIDEIHKAIMGNGKIGMKAEMDQIKGALRLTQFALVAIGLAITALSLYV